jgi:hypothetical protein
MIRRLKVSLTLSLVLFAICSMRAQSGDLLLKAKAHLNTTYPSLTSLKGVDWIITDQSTDVKNGITYIYLRQTYQGIEISNANSNMAVKDGKIVHQAGKIITKIKQTESSTTPSLGASEAINRAASHVNLQVTEPLISSPSRGGNRNLSVFSTGGISLEPIPVKLVYWQNESGELVLAYDMSIYPHDQQNWWSLRIDANSGALLEKGDWVTKCHFDLNPHQHHEFTQSNTLDGVQRVASETAQYNVFPYPVESPNHGSLNLEVAPFDIGSSPFGWHDTNGISGAEYTITRGNNVFAYEDRADANTAGFSPDGGSALDFNFPLNFDLTPLDYQSASITNLFYWNNIIHDIMVHYGFDEQSGNFQTRNYSGLGLGNDAVRAEDQDGSGTNNANFGTPPDGNAPRMQMYLWESSEGGYELIINSPVSIAGTYAATGASFGGAVTSLSGNLVLVNDGSATPSQGCGALINAAAINGNIAVVDRGSCTFVQKALNAQNAGAVALLVLNNVAGDPINMGGDNAQAVTIPLLMVSQTLGNQIKSNLPGVNVSFNDNRKFITSSYDNGIIVHEYGHGISTRLTGGASNSGCLSTVEQMGEGWSDYFALMLTLKEGDQGSDARGIGTYAAGQPITGQGIRPAPYTTNMGINGFTYADLSNSGISQPHGIGFLWCTMIWDMTWLMIERHGFDSDIYTGSGGNNMALQLVVDGLKLQACNPGFIDGRDAILLADRLNNNGANQDIIWEAFARRGLGAGASQGSPNNRNDGVVSFEIPTSIQISTSVDNFHAFQGDVLTYTTTIENIFLETQSSIIITIDLPEELSLLTNSLPDGATFDGTSIQFTIDELAGQETISFTFQAEVISSNGSPYLFFDDQENGSGNWIKTAISNTNEWNLQENNPNGGNNAWFVVDADAISEQMLTLKNPIIVTLDTKLAISHNYNTEGDYDGGVIEISINGGNNWSDLGSKMIQNGYNSVLTTGAENPIEGRNAFSGTSQGYIKTVIDLGSYAGSSALIRFRFASDVGVGGVGWFVDEVLFYVGEEQVVSNQACVTYAGQTEVICSPLTLTTLLSDDEVCVVSAGKITPKTTIPITVCDFEGTEFEVGNNSTSIDAQYRYFITSTAAPYSILVSNTTGTIDHSSLSEGSYLIWGMSYSNNNIENDLATYLVDISTIDEIQTAINGGEICAQLTNKFSNGNQTQLIKVDCTPLSTEIALSKNISVYPNPSNGQVTLRFKDMPADTGIFSIISLSGQTLFTDNILTQTSLLEQQIDLSTLSAGLYIVQVELNGELHQGRLVIK